MGAVSTHGGGSNDVQRTLWNMPNRPAAAILVSLLVVNATHSYFLAQLALSFTPGDLLDKGDNICLARPPPVHASFSSRTGFSIPTARRISSTFPTYALAHSAATLQNGKRHLMHHLHKFLRNRKIVFFQPYDVLAVEAGAWTTGHDEFPHTILPVKRKRHLGRRSENEAV